MVVLSIGSEHNGAHMEATAGTCDTYSVSVLAALPAIIRYWQHWPPPPPPVSTPVTVYSGGSAALLVVAVWVIPAELLLPIYLCLYSLFS